jgi:hypothetical protein
MTKKWKLIYGKKLLPERREIKPIGRIILFGKELSEIETRNYCRSLLNVTNFNL